MKGKNILYPEKQPFEKSLESMLKGYKKSESRRYLSITGLVIKIWHFPKLDIAYKLAPFGDEFEGVEINPKFRRGDYHALTYYFNFDIPQMDRIEPYNGGFRYKIIFPEYRGVLDDKHTRKAFNDEKEGKTVKKHYFTAPKIYRSEFLRELKKIINCNH